MSEMWRPEPAAMRVAPHTIARSGAFTPWAAKLASAPDEIAFGDEDEDGPDGAADPDGIALDAFAQGFEEGQRATRAELADERAALRALAAGLGALRPEPPAALAGLIAEAVGRLVRQIVGEAAIDGSLLRARAGAVAALVADEARPARMRLHPEDACLLADADIPVDIVADAALAPGSILLETGDGWIEDGIVVALDRLRVQLDAMGLPR